MKTILHNNLNKINFQEVIDIYVANGWGSEKDYTVRVVKNFFQNTTYCAFAIHPKTKQLLGFCRVLSDNIHDTWINEIVVRPEYHKQTVGGELLENIKNKFKHTSIYTETFLGTEHFFQTRGFKARKNMVVCSMLSSF